MRTVALWTVRAPEYQRREVIEEGDVIVRVTSIALYDASAERLLERAETACFAPGARTQTMSSLDLCRRVVRVLKDSKASWWRRHSPLGRKRIEAETSLEQLREWLRRALTAASAADVLCNAWIPDRGRPEPVIFDEFVRFGQDQGVEEGREEGREALRRSLLDLIEARGIPIGDEERARIAAETSFEWLRAWMRRALTAMSAAEVVDDEAG